MRFNIRQKIFTFGDNFVVKNENDEPYLTVQGKVFAFGNKLKIFDDSMNELYYIEQKLFKFLPEYRIYEQGRETAFLKKEFTLFKPRINIDSEYGNFTIEGSLLQHNFQVYKGSKIVASISKKYISFSDNYTLDVNDDENIPFIITLVIVIDQILHDNKRRN